MTNTPMRFEEWYKQFETSEGINLLCEESAHRGWCACEAKEEQAYDTLLTDYNLVRESRDNLLASQSQQAQTIAELVEALEEVAPSLVIASDHYYDLHGSESPLANKYNELHVKLHALIAKVKGK